MSSNPHTSMDLNNFSLDDLPDLPAFVTFPTGSFHVVLVDGLERKTIGEHPAVEMKMTLKEVVELANADDGSDIKPLDVCSTIFLLDNAFGMGKLKEVMKPIAAHCGSQSFVDIAIASKGLEVVVTGKRTYDKVKDRHYFNVINMGVV